MPGRAKGFCNLLHYRALGYYPATHAKMAASHDSLTERAVALGIASPDVLALGSWSEMLHPRNPAGTAAGGKFAAGSGAAKKGGAGNGGAGAKGKGAKGKGAAKSGKGAAKGGKKPKGAAAAASAAQAKQVYDNFLKQTPQQRAVFLSKLSNPQLSALYKAANAGNTNDPSTRSALIAIKDQMAARSLTGAKGPTQINQAKAASAAKAAASKQASATRRAASAAKSAASKQASAARRATAAKAAAARRSVAAAKRQQRASAAAARAQATAARRSTAAKSRTPKTTAAKPAPQKAQAAMQATTPKTKVSGLTAALTSTSNPAQQRQILAQLKTTLGLAQSARVTDTLAMAFTSALHPHQAAGSPAGGQFAPARNSQAAQAQQAPGAKAAYDKALATKPGDAKAQLAAMDNAKLIALTKATYSFKSSDPKVVALRMALASELAKRGGNVNDYGGLGKGTPGGPKPLKGGPAKAPGAAVKAAPKGPAVTQRPAVRAPAAVQKPVATKAQSTATVQAATARATAAVQAAARSVSLKSAHTSDAALALAMPMVSSQDGPMVTMNDSLRTPHDIRRAVIAHGKVHPTMRPAYRKTVKAAAKRMGAMQHVPDAWMGSNAG